MNQALANEMLRVAETQIGVHEATGRNDGAAVHVYQDYIGHWCEGQPWCAAFVSWCLNQAAHKLGVTPMLQKTASAEELYNEGKRRGLLIAHPVAGCIGLLREHGKVAHAFMVTGVSGPLVGTIDGNYSNQVMRTSHPILECYFVAVA